MRGRACRRVQAGTLCIVLLALATGMGGCSAGERLTPDERARLDSLDATGAVEAYFASGSEAVELHLSTPEERQRRRSPNYQPETERDGGVSDLVIAGGGPVTETLASASAYQDQRQFTVTYRSSRASAVGGRPGMRFYFVYTGRSPEDGTWKVLEVGTGP